MLDGDTFHYISDSVLYEQTVSHLRPSSYLKGQIILRVSRNTSDSAYFEFFKRKPDKMVKHTHTICRLFPTNCLSVFDHCVGLVLKGLKTVKILIGRTVKQGGKAICIERV